MAVPQSQTMLDISGKYALNKALSDSDASDKILEQQGVGYLKRKAMGMAGATILIKNYKGDDGVEILEVIPQIMGATPKGEIRPLNWTEQVIDHPLFGKVTTKNRRVKPAELEDENLKKGWTNETLEAGVFLSYMAGDKWTLIQAWGLQAINGKRYHARQATFIGPKGNDIHARFVYDYGKILAVLLGQLAYKLPSPKSIRSNPEQVRNEFRLEIIEYMKQGYAN